MNALSESVFVCRAVHADNLLYKRVVKWFVDSVLAPFPSYYYYTIYCIRHSKWYKVIWHSCTFFSLSTPLHFCHCQHRWQHAFSFIVQMKPTELRAWHSNCALLYSDTLLISRWKNICDLTHTHTHTSHLLTLILKLFFCFICWSFIARVKSVFQSRKLLCRIHKFIFYIFLSFF